ncbi:hypothetical protein [Actinocorallia populi]|uniref:hypothetical protein n=1 Tax=Actinocorallia populi TaxID=2079200 RepID=UPI000D08C5CC|nr:hypothetical protein [Actinocorallia populi]
MSDGMVRGVVAALFWASMVSLFVGIFRWEEPDVLAWFIGFGVLLGAAYAVRYWGRRQGGG